MSRIVQGISAAALAGALIAGGYGLGFILLGELSNAVFDMADKLLVCCPVNKWH